MQRRDRWKMLMMALQIGTFPFLMAFLVGLVTGTLMASPVAGYLPQWLWNYFIGLGGGNAHWGAAVLILRAGIPLAVLTGINSLLESFFNKDES